MAKEAWSRWGEKDERGALNHIGPAQVRRAVELVKRGEVFTLAQPISSNTPVPGNRCRPTHFMGRDGGDYAAGMRKPGKFQYADDTILMPIHSGTHIDSLCHVWYDDQLYNGFSGNDVRSTGAVRCGAEKLGSIVARGVLLDFVALTGKPLADGEIVTASLLEAAFAKAKVTVGKGDVVLLRTGWMDRNKDNRHPDYDREPGINEEAGLLLANAEVAVVGADNYAVEVLPFAEGTVFPVHQRLIRDYGIPLLENVVLQPLAAQGVSEFLFMASPLPIVGGTGSPLAPVAIL